MRISCRVAVLCKGWFAWKDYAAAVHMQDCGGYHTSKKQTATRLFKLGSDLYIWKAAFETGLRCDTELLGRRSRFPPHYQEDQGRMIFGNNAEARLDDGSCRR
jgi:hypothetical protein